MPEPEQRPPVRVFVSYSHANSDLRERLSKHLKVMVLEGRIAPWSDSLIEAGEVLDDTIMTALEAAELILLLISPDFIASDYCYGKEATRAIEKTLMKPPQARVVPIILHPCDWARIPFGNPPRRLGEFKALPTDAKPVVDWPSVDHALADVTKHLRTLVTRIQETRPGV